MTDDVLARTAEDDAAIRREFGPAGRWLAQYYFAPVRFPEAGRDELSTLSKQGFVVHVMRATAWINYLYLHWALVRRELPPIRAVVNLRRWFTRPFTLAQLTGDHTERFTSAMASGGSGLVFLRESGFNTARGKESREDPFPALVQLARRSDRPIYLVPELLLWEKWQQKVTPSLFDRVFGSPEAPGFAHSVATFLRNFRRAQLKIGTPIDLRQVLEQEAGRSDEVIARKVRSTLHNHLARQTRAVFGPPAKEVGRLIDEAMRDRHFQIAVTEVATEKHKTVEATMKDAKKNFEAIAAKFSPTVVGASATVLDWIFNRIYDGLEVDEAGLERAMKAAVDAPVVLTPSHKSHLDYLIMSYVLWTRGYTAPLVAAGANLSFFPLGPYLRRAGAFFLRRSFRGDKLYTASFKAYLKKLVHDGINHEFFPEGGRSRTGKLLQPKLGLFTWLVDAVLEGARNDLLFVPISIDYEKVVEGASYTAELQGGEKKPEDFKALLSAPAVLTQNYGRIHLRFDEPVSLAKLMEERKVSRHHITEDQKRGLVRALGHRVMYGISKVSTVTPHALLASALLAHRRRGSSVRELTDRIMALRGLALDLGAPLSRQLKDAPSSPTVMGPIMDAMRMFAREGFVRSEEARGEPIFSVEDNRRSELSFYKNTILNLIAGRTIVSAALLASEPDPSRQRIKDRALFLSRLLKIELVYPVGKSFDLIFDETVEHLTRIGWLTADAHTIRVAPESHARPLVTFLRAMVLDILETYALVSRVAASTAWPVEKKAFVEQVLDIGRAEFLAGTINLSEALSKITVENAVAYLIDQQFLVDKDKKLSPGSATVATLSEQIAPFLEEPR